MEFSPGFSPKHNVLPKKYRPESGFKPKERKTIVHEGYETPRRIEQNRKHRVDAARSAAMQSVRGINEPRSSYTTPARKFSVIHDEEQEFDTNVGKSPFARLEEST